MLVGVGVAVAIAAAMAFVPMIVTMALIVGVAMAVVVANIMAMGIVALLTREHMRRLHIAPKPILEVMLISRKLQRRTLRKDGHIGVGGSVDAEERLPRLEVEAQ
jgi:hypothetical protein